MTPPAPSPPFLALFPPDVAGCALDAGAALPDLPPEEARAVEGAIASRRREFTAGRACARRALERLGVSGAPAIVIPRGADRAPRWPEGIRGSISHKEGTCGAVVCRASAHAGIGLDIEKREPLAAALWRVVLTEDERNWLAGIAEDERGYLARVLFSAKEALYKAQHAVTRRYVGFREVTVLPASREAPPGRGIRRGAFVARFLRDVSPRFPEGSRLRGRWAESPRWIHTGIVIDRGDLAGA